MRGAARCDLFFVRVIRSLGFARLSNACASPAARSRCGSARRLVHALLDRTSAIADTVNPKMMLVRKRFRPPAFEFH